MTAKRELGIISPSHWREDALEQCDPVTDGGLADQPSIHAPVQGESEVPRTVPRVP